MSIYLINPLLVSVCKVGRIGAIMPHNVLFVRGEVGNVNTFMLI